MKTNKKYITPEIALITLDNDISLQLSSDVNPEGEPEWVSSYQVQSSRV